MTKQILSAIIAASVIGLSPSRVIAQTAAAPSAVEQAIASRDRGDLAAAAQLLQSHLSIFPDDGNAARLLAQIRYWLKDVAGATTLYDAALSRHPHDTSARLDYARMLMETRSDARAIALLEPFRNAPAVESRVATMLGTIAYWRGDLSAAARYFGAALRANPTDADAQRQLDEIRSLSAPWLSLMSGAHTDDQPLRGYSLAGEAGYFVRPLTSVGARIAQLGFDLGDEPGPGPSANFTLAEGRFSHYAPSLRAEVRLAAGATRRARGSPSSEWTGRAAIRLRLPSHIFAEANAERAPYFHTLASLSTPVINRSGGAVLGIDDPRGWLGEVAVQIRSFPDTNTVSSSHAWMLAPLLSRRSAVLQFGYAFTRQNADSSRYVLARPVQVAPPGDPAFNLAGLYAPYYTPDDLQSHAALAAITLRPSSSSTFRMNGSYAFSASQNLPYFERPGSIPIGGGSIRRSTVRQDFSPFSARASFEHNLSERTSFFARAEHVKTAFYSISTAGLNLTYRFARR